MDELLLYLVGLFVVSFGFGLAVQWLANRDKDEER